jgi:uncharacterized iron-regulated membrane protein
VTETLLLGIAVVAAFACPLHMWWRHRRGHQAACCPPSKAGGSRTESLEQLRARRADVEARLAEFGVDAGSRTEPERSRT